MDAWTMDRWDWGWETGVAGRRRPAPPGSPMAAARGRDIDAERNRALAAAARRSRRRRIGQARRAAGAPAASLRALLPQAIPRGGDGAPHVGRRRAARAGAALDRGLDGEAGAERCGDARPHPR